jgi:hypothetical protein
LRHGEWSPSHLSLIGFSYGIAALVIARAPEPPGNIVSTGRLATDAWQGVIYTWRNRTLRGLGFSISALNLANGTVTIVVPLLVLQRFHLSEATSAWSSLFKVLPA